MGKTPRTQAMRFLDSKKIPYTIHEFSENIRDAKQVANELHIAAEQVFKTLILLREDDRNERPFIYMVPADSEIDLRQFARELGIKSARMASHEVAEKITGLKVGGISALALLDKPFAIYLDRSAENFSEILVSAGQRGIDIQISVRDLQAVTGAHLIQATRAKSG
jgi:Cys-tRNA(Pro)/Cys-tRNA(Cys) deacylase